MEKLRELAFLGRCAAFGFTAQELHQAARDGYEGTVDRLLHAPPEPLEGAPPTTVLPPGIALVAAQIAALVVWWLQRLCRTRSPLHEKMVLFWHGHFTTSAEQVFSGELLLSQHKLLREHALGPFPELLREVSLHPAMLVYLDGAKNTKDHPNENFAREVMELFTLGEGNYSENDVRQAARALTGWDVQWLTGKSVFRSERHDGGPKRVLGQVVSDARELLDVLARRPETARYLTRRLYRFFAGREPSGPELARLAAVFSAHRGNVKPLVRAILLSPEFRQLAARREAVRCPLEWTVWVCRSLGIDFAQGIRRGALDWRQFETLRSLGQLPFFPPSVRGWPEGAAWINAATLQDRWKFAAWAAGQTTVSPADWFHQLGMLDASAALRREAARLKNPLSLILCSPEAQLR